MGLDIISEGKGKCLLKEPKWSKRNIHQQNIGSFGRFSYDLEMKTREQNRNNKRTEIKRFDWFIEWIQTRVAFGWLSERSGEKTSCPRTRNQSILRPDVIMQHDWPIEQCLLHIRVFFGGKTKSPRFDLFIHWLIQQITNTYRNHFSRFYENRSISWYIVRY